MQDQKTTPHVRIAIGLVAAAIPLLLIATFVMRGSDRDAASVTPSPAQVVQAEPAPKVHDVIANITVPEERTQLEQLYAAVDGTPLWSGDSSAKRRLGSLNDELAGIEAHGLDTSNLIAARERLLASEPTDRARYDVMLTSETLALAKAIRFGQVSKDQLGDWEIAADTVDIVPELAAALKDAKPGPYLRELAPSDPQYAGLVTAFGRYKDLVTKGGWSTGELGLDKDPELLRSRLIAEGYLANETAMDKAALQAALQAFQAHNGLEPDGRIGKATLTALSVSAEQRVGHILANLERRRHMPRALGADRVVVNTADQSLFLIRNDAPVMKLRTIVGERKHPTPILALKMAAVTFNPPWDIPPSIASKEILPHLHKNPNYLADNDMVIVNGPADDPQGLHVDWKRYTSRNFPMRLRQVPGERAALGRVKFEMWNSFNIYLHDTPGRHLFDKSVRYMSHGCVRVEHPHELARHVLMNQPGWSAESIMAAIDTGESKTISLKQPLPVYILYWTAFLDDAGQLQFRDDAYGWDAPVLAALRTPAKRTVTQVASGQ